MNGNHTHPEPTAAMHGMLIVGAGPIFLSHLPMFHVPHDHQLIVEIEFDGPDNPRAAYIDDRAASGEPVYTSEPQPFVLTDLLDPARAPEMQGTIFRGHFERRDTALRYIVSGPPSGQFAAHIISGPPDFDHVIAVDVVPPPGTATTVVVSGRSNQPDQRLREGDRVAVAASPARPPLWKAGRSSTSSSATSVNRRRCPTSIGRPGTVGRGDASSA